MNHVHAIVRQIVRFGAVCALACATSASYGQAGGGAGGDGSVQPSAHGTVTLAVQDTDLGQVLEMLAIQFQKNIITSRNVSATINANLFDVTLDEALHAILEVNGFGYRTEGNFIYIYTLSELDEIEARKRRRESRTFELDHISARDAREMVEPLLSEGGRVAARGEVSAGFAPSESDGGADNYAFTTRLVVNDYPEILEAIAALIVEVDTAPRQVLVEATILQSNLNEDNAFGIDFGAISSLNFTDLSNPLAAVSNLLAGNDSGADVPATSGTGFKPGDNRAFGLQSTVGNTPGAGGLKVGVIRSDVSVFLRLLDEVTNNTVLARPKVMCLNRQRAEIVVGTQLGQITTTVTETSRTQSIEYVETGITLRFRPFIAQNGMIRMELTPTVTDGFDRDVLVDGGTTTVIDKFENRLTTNVRVRDGETMVLGGLYRERNQTQRRQVPVLGDIPFLGAAFRGHDDVVRRDEIIFMITPTIIKDDLLWSIGRETLNYTDRVLLGSRRGLLPFSRERQTAGHNTRAYEAFERGDVDRATYHLNNSLRLNPAQPEMAKFRQRLLGQTDKQYERSLMERILRDELSQDADRRSHGFAAPTRFSPQSLPAPSRGEVVASASSVTAEGEAGAGVAAPSVNENGEAVSETEGSNPAANATRSARAEREAFTNRFIYEYFAAAGLSEFFPFEMEKEVSQTADVPATREFPQD